MNAWLMIGGMLVITFATRYSFFAWPELRFPPLLRQSLNYVPIAMLTAIVVPGMFIPDGQTLNVSWRNAYLLAGLFTVAVAAITRHLLATVVCGLAAFFLLRWMLGQLPL